MQLQAAAATLGAVGLSSGGAAAGARRRDSGMSAHVRGQSGGSVLWMPPERASQMYAVFDDNGDGLDYGQDDDADAELSACVDEGEGETTFDSECDGESAALPPAPGRVRQPGAATKSRQKKPARMEKAEDLEKEAPKKRQTAAQLSQAQLALKVRSREARLPLHFVGESFSQFIFSSRSPYISLFDSHKGDVYALAMTLWEIQSRKEPFANLSTFRVGRLVMGGERPAITKGCDPTFADVVRMGWHQQPEKRPSAQDIVRTLEALLLQGEEV